MEKSNGRQALKLGLIDELGSVSQAIKAIKERAEITTDIKWVHAPSRSSVWSMFGGNSDDEQTVLASCVNECLTIVENRYNNHLVS